jgi:hypothetical protein
LFTVTGEAKAAGRKGWSNCSLSGGRKREEIERGDRDRNKGRQREETEIEREKRRRPG